MLVPFMNDNIFVHTKVDGISYALVKYGIREQDMIHIISKIVLPGMKVLDLGGNIGFYSIILSNIVGPNGKVYAVEPDKRNFELLKYNSLSRKNIEVYNIAIGDRNYLAKLGITTKSNLNTFIEDASQHKISYQEIQMYKLDSFVQEIISSEINFIRMDIEGFEYEVLSASIDFLKAYDNPLAILFETHSNYYDSKRNMKFILEELCSAGYEIKYLVSSGGSASVIQEKFGLVPNYTMKADGYERSFYLDLPNVGMCGDLLMHKPKLIRYLLLSKGF